MDTNTTLLENEKHESNHQGMDSKLETKRILLYLAITFIVTYAVEIGLIRPLLTGDDQQLAMVGQSLVGMVMFIPAIGVLLTRLITKEGLRNTLLQLPKFKPNLRYYLFAWFGPAILTALGALLYFALNPGKFDPNLTNLAKAYAGSGLEMTTSKLQTTMLIQIATAFFIGPLINALNCFGEEWGWRGYLLPKMKGKFKIIPMLLINGVIWGVWHAPLTALGHNYGTGYLGFPFTGIFAMVIFCIVLGTIFSYVTIKTNSCLPAIFAHGSINSIAAVGIYYSVDGGNPFVGPSPTGIIGGIGFILVAVVFMVRLVREEKSSNQGTI
jgi:membrane protease YdiL (CAAX protease family)